MHGNVCDVSHERSRLVPQIRNLDSQCDILHLMVQTKANTVIATKLMVAELLVTHVEGQFIGLGKW